MKAVSECICTNPECWGYTCPVHNRKCVALVPASSKIRVEDRWWANWLRELSGACLTDPVEKEKP